MNSRKLNVVEVALEVQENKIFEEFIATSRYCRWIEDEGRRETWGECVERYVTWILERNNQGHDEDLHDRLYNAIYNKEVFPSMRALMTAGPAAEVDETCLYNCAYLPIDSLESFAEVLYILCCGTGVGFSVEQEEVDHLSEVSPVIIRDENYVITVEDSRAGWANAFKKLLLCLQSGLHPTWDTSLIRPAGARLKTFGGRASGPEPLERLFRYVTKVFYNARGRRLTALECHDIVCLVGEIVIAGAVRRSALISLSDLHDREMSRCKSGTWWEATKHRSLANNSAVYTKKPSLPEFMDEWKRLYDSKSGERGIFNREAIQKLAETDAGRDPARWGTNPCSEIILRPRQFCNLTEVVLRAGDTHKEIMDKVVIASILGTLQSACTNFPWLSDVWKKNCEDERLLGVSFTGIMDHQIMCGTYQDSSILRRWLTDFRKKAHETNRKYADILGISPSKSVTCVKPSGTTSCLAGTSSGLHPRYSEQYVRRVRADIKDPICQLMIDQGVPHEPCVLRPDTTMVFSFPQKSPDSSVVARGLTAIDHLRVWHLYQTWWCDHKPSITVTYREDEFLEVGGWVFNNWEHVSGISFLPYNGMVYDQAPFEKLDKLQYQDLCMRMPKSIDWSKLSEYELEDCTTNQKTLACTANSCELVDLEAV